MRVSIDDTTCSMYTIYLDGERLGNAVVVWADEELGQVERKYTSPYIYGTACSPCAEILRFPNSDNVNPTYIVYGKVVIKKRRIYSAQYYQKRRKIIDAVVDVYKVDKGCKDCGYGRHPAPLHLLHPGRYDKIDNLVMFCVSKRETVDTLKKEMAKCEIICENCMSIRRWEKTREYDNH